MKISSQAPTRISLFGGGTDINPYAEKYGGVVFNMAINIRQHIQLDTLSNEWQMPEQSVGNFYIPFFDEFKVHTLMGMTAHSDSIIESGLGSSASAAVALIGALAKYKNIKMTKDEVAEKAWDIEVNKLKLFGGKQDQYAAVYGGVNIMEFGKETRVTPLSPSFIEFLIPYMVLFHTGKNRKSGKIQEGFKKLTEYQIKALDNIKALTIKGIDAVARKDVTEVGALLNLAWQLKKQSNKGVTNKRIDDIYNRAIKSGAYGGKIMGAGGGGHILFICEPLSQPKLRKEMESVGCRWVDFGIDFNGLETRIL